MNYRHSRTFGELKSIHEGLQSNLTSAQYLHTLDYFLWNAIRPIANACPQFFLNFVAKVVARQTIAPNAKYTSGDKHQLPIQLVKALIADSDDQRVKEVQDMYLNRGLTFGFVGLFLTTCGSYNQATDVQIRAKRFVLHSAVAATEHRLGARYPLYEVIKSATFWSDKARAWKSTIVEKYTRLALNAAQKTYVDYGHRIDLDDITQVYLVITAKAIDRCDPRMGVLTTFIQQWFKSAKAIVDQMAETRVEESLDALSDVLGDSMNLGSVDPDRTREILNSISWAAQAADPEGYVRTALGIPQWVSAKDREFLAHFVA